MGWIKGREKPAYYIVTILGGVKKTAEILNISQSAVSRWMSPDGTKGQIPLKYWDRLFEYAREKNIKLTPEDLLK